MKLALIVAALALSLSTGAALAADRDQLQDQMTDRDQLQKQDQVYGSQLMTQQEFNRYRVRMLAAKTDPEREKIRNEHHQMMKLRAKERGVILPDRVPARGGAMQGDRMGRGKKYQ